MMKNLYRLLVIIDLVGMSFIKAYADEARGFVNLRPKSVGFGYAINNNKLTNYWAYCPLPNFYINYGKLIFAIEGLQTNCQKDAEVSGKTFYKRISFMPMLEQRWHFAYAKGGIGLSQIYQHDEHWDNKGNLIIYSQEQIKLTIKSLIGAQYQVTADMKFWIECGATIITKQKYALNLGAGISRDFIKRKEAQTINSAIHKKTSWISNCLIASGLAACTTSYFYQYRAEQTFHEYFRETIMNNVVWLHTKTTNYDNKSNHYLAIGFGLIATGILNSLLFER